MSERLSSELPDGPERWIKELSSLAITSILAYGGKPTPHRRKLIEEAEALQAKLLADLREEESEELAPIHRGDFW